MTIKADALFTSNTCEWETPQNFFDALNEEFHFGIDVCATPENAKCNLFFTLQDDGLKQDWSGHGTVWCNPPYGKTIRLWVQKASETAKEGTTVVMLIHARTDTRWFHDYIYQKPNVEIRFVKGRLKFGGSNNSAPFPSMVAIFRGDNKS